LGKIFIISNCQFSEIQLPVLQDTIKQQKKYILKRTTQKRCREMWLHSQTRRAFASILHTQTQFAMPKQTQMLQ